MFLNICLLFFSFVFSLTSSTKFLGGSLTYQYKQQTKQNSTFVLIQIRFQISNDLFHCTSDQSKVNLADDIQCFSEKSNAACTNFRQELWGYCRIENEINQYLIIKRAFLLNVEHFKPLTISYSKQTNIFFHLNLTMNTNSIRKNSSPYPYLPAAYYVAFNQTNLISIFIVDVDGDEILCENASPSFTVFVNENCQISYKIDRVGQQFGQFWLIDRYENEILSRSLINLQVNVLETILCSNLTELILLKLNRTIRNLYETIEIIVQLYPHCHLIKFNEQKIIELTGLCRNSSLKNLNHGGIEIRFECEVNLCGRFHYCFVGEMGFKLPATKVHCMTIDVVDSDLECIRAANAHDFNVKIQRRPNQTIVIDQKLDSQSRSWLWILLAYLGFILSGIIIYSGLKQKTIELQSPKSVRFTETSIDTRRSTKLSEPLLTTEKNSIRKSGKNRTQYLRLGSVDQPKKIKILR